MNANERHHLTSSAVPPFPYSPVSTEYPWTMHDDAESRQARHTAQFRAMHSRQLNPPSPSGHKENDVVIWNGQHCFDWVDPVDIRLSLLGDIQTEHPPPPITIIEYHSVQPSLHVEALAMKLAEIEEHLVKLSDRLEGVVTPLAEQNQSLRNDENDEHFVRPLLASVVQILDRLEDELRDVGDASASGPLVNGRVADREEYRQLLARYGVERRYARRGDRFQGKYHEKKRGRRAASAGWVGRISRTLRPAYLRMRDGQVIRRAWVEVYDQANGVVGH